jgi:sugar phosphate isomerase/epimerase
LPQDKTEPKSLNPLAVSTWSLHRLLGPVYAHGPGSPDRGEESRPYGDGALALPDLPRALTARGFNRVEICHFHLRSLDEGYLRAIRDAFRTSGVTIQTLLVDAGDVTDPVHGARDRGWIAPWIDVAVNIGAENVRVIAGKTKPSPETLKRSIEALADFAAIGETKGVRVVTENWFDLLASPREVDAVLDGVGESLGFLADTGNWRGPGKFSDLRAIFARAELCHAKSAFSDDGAMDEKDAAGWLAAACEAGYRGPFTLIFDGPGDEWRGLEREREFALRFA